MECDGQRLRHRGRIVVARVGDGAADRAPATSRTRPARRPPEGRACGTRRTGSCAGGDTSGSDRTRFPAPETTRSPARSAVTSIAAARRRAPRTRVRARPRDGRGPGRDPIPRRPCRRSPRGPPRARPRPGQARPGPGRSRSGRREAPWKTAALMAQHSIWTLTLRLVSRAASSAAVPSPSGNVAVSSGVGSSAARRHEADRARPQPGGADDPAHLERLGLHEPDLDGRAAADVDADEHDARAERRDREGARHRGRSARSLDHDVEAASAGRLGHLLGERRRGRVDRSSRPDLETRARGDAPEARSASPSRPSSPPPWRRGGRSARRRSRRPRRSRRSRPRPRPRCRRPRTARRTRPARRRARRECGAARRPWPRSTRRRRR